jgi:hypothetical protein
MKKAGFLPPSPDQLMKIRMMMISQIGTPSSQSPSPLSIA